MFSGTQGMQKMPKLPELPLLLPEEVKLRNTHTRKEIIDKKGHDILCSINENQYGSSTLDLLNIKYIFHFKNNKR
jgi:hypothetical protein